MFEWLENTSVAIWVGESLWAYPFWLGLHVVGLAVVVGIFSIRDLRLMGLFSGLAPDSFLALSKFAWIGFVVNAISGFFLFASQAVTFVNTVPFLLKIGCIVAGMGVASNIQARLRGELSGSNGDAVISSQTKLIALISIALWVAAIVNGRLIAYFT
jgi:hypothetical protein